MNIQGFADPVRAEIMRLENESVFDPAAWDRVFHALQEQGRVSGYEDAYRRMKTAMDNATSFLPDPILANGFCGVDVGSGDRSVMMVVTDLGIPGGSIELTFVPVAVETEMA